MNNDQLFDSNTRHQLYDSFGALLTYPDENFFKYLERVGFLVEQSGYKLNDSFGMFQSLLGGLNLEDIQEFYTNIFELNPKCTINVGVQIFNEDTLKRSMLMTRLRDAYVEYGVEEKTELPDFLPFVLRLSTKINDEDKLYALMNECLIEPVEKMAESFGTSQNPYGFLLKAIYKILKADLKKLNSVAVED